MNGVVFGKKIKKLRTASGLSTRELSQQIGKGTAYVSQLERGMIKKPDFETCYRLLVHLGMESSKIEDFLNQHDIVSPEREQAELELSIKHAEIQAKQQEEMYRLNWFGKTAEVLEQANDVLHRQLNFFIAHDISRAERVLSNLLALTKSQENFDFFCSLFQTDFSTISSGSKQKLLQMVEQFAMEDKNQQFFESESDDE